MNPERKAALKQCCQLARFGLGKEDPDRFTQPQWPRIPKVVYSVYRWIVAAYFLIWIMLSGLWKYDWFSSEGNRSKWFIYLTNWSYLTLTIAVLWQAVIVFREQYCRRGHVFPHLMDWSFKLCWVLYNVSANMALTVTIMYWMGNAEPGEGLKDVHPVDINTHLTNSVYVMLDLALNKIPIRWQHAFHGAVASVLYSVFNVVYTVSGGTNALGEESVYSSYDWNNDPMKAFGTCVLNLVVTVASWMFLYVLYQLRVAIWRRIYERTGSQLAGEKAGLLANQSDQEEGGQCSYQSTDEKVGQLASQSDQEKGGQCSYQSTDEKVGQLGNQSDDGKVGQLSNDITADEKIDQLANSSEKKNHT